MEILFIKCFGGRSSSTSRKHPSSTTMEYLGHRFSLSQLQKLTGDFDKSRIIGEGPYGVAYKASTAINGQLKDITVKRLRKEAGNSSHGLSLYKNDILFMCQLRHPNLVSFVGFCDDENEMIVVYDYAPNGSLYRELYGVESNSSAISWKKRLEICLGVARGLHYLHSGTKNTIIHGNIAPSTILFGENWVPKLTFFGRSLKGPRFSAKDMKPIKLEYVEGPWGYIAPECFSGNINVTYKCDVYSFGVILLELICGKTLYQVSQLKGRHIETAHVIPFTFSVVKEVRNLLETGNDGDIIDERLVGEIGVECWELYMDITQSCLCEDPSERPDMGDVEVQLERLLQLQ